EVQGLRCSWVRLRIKLAGGKSIILHQTVLPDGLEVGDGGVNEGGAAVGDVEPELAGALADDDGSGGADGFDVLGGDLDEEASRSLAEEDLGHGAVLGGGEVFQL